MAEVSSLSFSFVGAYVHVYNDRAYVIGGSKSTANNYIYLWYPYHYTINRDEMVIILASSNPFNVIDTNSLVVNVGVSRAFIGDENNMSEPVELSRYNKGEWATS